MADKNSKAKAMTKTAVLAQLAEETGLSRKQVGDVLNALVEVAKAQLGKKGPGMFNIHGLVKLKKQHKPAVKAHEGINPFTKEKQMFKAKPARNVVKIRPLKKLKDMVS